MESFALGRPVVTTHLAGIPELVEPGISGWLIPSGSIDDLVIAMKKVLQSSVSELEQMGKMGFQRVSRQHNIKREAQKLADILASNIIKTEDAANSRK